MSCFLTGVRMQGDLQNQTSTSEIAAHWLHSLLNSKIGVTIPGGFQRQMQHHTILQQLTNGNQGHQQTSCKLEWSTANIISQLPKARHQTLSSTCWPLSMGLLTSSTRSRAMMRLASGTGHSGWHSTAPPFSTAGSTPACMMQLSRSPISFWVTCGHTSRLISMPQTCRRALQAQKVHSVKDTHYLLLYFDRLGYTL